MGSSRLAMVACSGPDMPNEPLISQASRILILRCRISNYPIDFMVMEGQGVRGGVEVEHLLSLMLPLKQSRTQRVKLHQIPIKEVS